MSCTCAKYYNSVFSSPESETKTICLNLFDIEKLNPKLMYKPVQKQDGGDDCGVFSISFALALTHGLNPVNFHFVQNDMRHHLLHCLEQKLLPPFTTTKEH